MGKPAVEARPAETARATAGARSRMEKVLVIFLRVVGTMELLALIGVVIPYSWMNAWHASMGLGGLPDDPVVGYLARSLSAFYMAQGGLLWLASFDPRRYRDLIGYVGVYVLLYGLALQAICYVEGMPVAWAVESLVAMTTIGGGLLVMRRWVPKESAA